MENNRIRRLILSEYNELSGEAILVESPFAETTRDGQGLREVAIALTKTRLIVAKDVFRTYRSYWCLPRVDPCIETLELISVCPLKFVALSVFCKKHRKTLKARFIDGRVKYYELGGMIRRDKLWTLWCKHVYNLLEGKGLESSLPESTVAATSTSSSTQYKISSGYQYESNFCCCEKNQSLSHDWNRFLQKDDSIVWTEKNLYLGSSYEELQGGRYIPLPVLMANGNLKIIQGELKDFSRIKKSRNGKYKNCPSKSNSFREIYKNCIDELSNIMAMKNNNKNCMDQSNSTFCSKKSSIRQRGGYDTSILYDRRQFPNKNSSSGVSDINNPKRNLNKCTFNRRIDSKVYKKNPNYTQNKRNGTQIKVARMLSKFGFDRRDKYTSNIDTYSYNNLCTRSHFDLHEMIENAVSVWENARNNRNRSSKINLRRYGISTATYFLQAFGPWSVHPGDRESLQNRRSHSCVSVRRQPIDRELRLPVSRRQLAASLSLTDLNDNPTTSTQGRVLLFWTPDYWYRPRAAVDAYQDIRNHLGQLKEFQTEKEKYVTRRGIFGRRVKRRLRDAYSQNANVHNHIISSNAGDFRGIQLRKRVQPNLSKGRTTRLRQLLKMNFRATIWDVDSTTLARQLTLIDLQLFLRIPGSELEILVRTRTSREAPNFGAWIAFAHRISCLTASEILAQGKVETRARSIARFLNAAHKCFQMGNFHSARSIVAGLQSPAIYRLRHTWIYLKVHHAAKYETMEKLSKIFKSPKTKKYRESWLKAEKNPPLIPFVGDILSRLLDDLNDEKFLNDSSRESVQKLLHKRKNNLKERSEVRQKRILEKMNCSKTKGGVRKLRFRTPRHEDSRRSRPWTTRQRNLVRKTFESWKTRILRKRGVVELVNWLERCQTHAKSYDFPGESLAWEFLLKARYKEDRDNFFLSLELEPYRDT